VNDPRDEVAVGAGDHAPALHREADRREPGGDDHGVVSRLDLHGDSLETARDKKRERDFGIALQSVRKRNEAREEDETYKMSVGKRVPPRTT